MVGRAQVVVMHISVGWSQSTVDRPGFVAPTMRGLRHADE
jgi:hypothetical protein